MCVLSTSQTSKKRQDEHDLVKSVVALRCEVMKDAILYCANRMSQTFYFETQHRVSFRMSLKSWQRNTTDGCGGTSDAQIERRPRRVLLGEVLF